MLSQQTENVCITCGAVFSEGGEVCPEDGTRLVPKVMASLVGTLFDGRYRILSLLGYGGAGAVYKGEQERLRRTVAIKILHPKLIDDPSKLARFEREGKALSTLSHINVISAHDYGVTSEQQPYLVMQYVEGKNLEDVIKADGGLQPERAVALYIQVLEGLIHAHRKGIVHRDLKPANIVLTEGEDGSELVKIVDFGIAKLSPDSGLLRQKLTQTGSVFGSPSYMSPEQWRGKRVDARSDIYSLGCVIYETLCGRVPFEVEQLLEVMLDFADIKAPHPCSVKPELLISTALDAMISKMMEIELEKRYQSVSDIKKDLLETPEYKAYWNQLGVTKKQKLLALQRKQATQIAIKRLGIAATLILAALAVGGWIRFTDFGAITASRFSLLVQHCIYPPGDARLIDGEKRLAELYLKHGDFFQAAKQLELVLNLVERKYGPLSFEMADLYGQLSEIYSRTKGDQNKRADYALRAMRLFDSFDARCERNNELDRAIAFCRKGLENRERLLPYKERAFFPALTHLADLELITGDRSGNKQYMLQAKRDYERALAESKRISPQDDRDVRQALIGIASACTSLGQYSDAEKAYKQALGLAQSNDSVTISIWNNLGTLYAEQKGSADAEQAIDRALALEQTMDNPDTATVKVLADKLEGLATTYKSKNEFANSARLYERVLAVRKKVFGPSSPVVETTLYALANVLDLSGKNDQAEPVFAKALSLAEKLDGPEDSNVPFVLVSLASCESKLGKNADALKHYGRAVRICRRKGPAMRRLLSVSLNGYANMLTRVRRAAEAAAARKELDQLCAEEKSSTRSTEHGASRQSH